MLESVDKDVPVLPERLPLQRLAAEPGRGSLTHWFEEAEKLKQIRQLGLPVELFQGVSPKIVTRYRHRAAPSS